MKRFSFFIGFVAVLASCSVREEDIEVPGPKETLFYASFEQPTEQETRQYVNEDLHLRWHAEDQVSIFNKTAANENYVFTGETGDNAGSIRRGEGNDLPVGEAIPHIVSVYPYQESTSISEDETLSVILPIEQYYAEDSFGRMANTMVSVTSDNNLLYKSVGGYLRIRLYGEEVSVTSITLRGNKDEKIAGKALITMPLDDVPSTTMEEDAFSRITLNCSDTPVALNATKEGSIDFWFVVPPVTFTEGFTISIDVASGGIVEKTTSKAVSIERNQLITMSAFKIEKPSIPEPDIVDLGLSVQWATFDLMATSPQGDGAFFLWGETTKFYSVFPFESRPYYKWFTKDEKLTKYCTLSKYGVKDNKITLDPEDDAAHVNLGGKWRMPTREELEELLNLCTFQWLTPNYYRVIGPNGNHILLNCHYYKYVSKSGEFPQNGGFLWSSSLDTEDPRNAFVLYLPDPDNAGSGDTSICLKSLQRGHYIGYIRPVFPGLATRAESVSLDRKEIEMSLNDSTWLVSTIFPENTTNKTVSWASSDESVATVSSSGLVKAHAEGNAVITVTTKDGGRTATCRVCVHSGSVIHVPEIIDLGLSIKWASCNLGAIAPPDYGDFFAYGETEPKETYSSYPTGFADAAHVILGDQWRMPTLEEMNELLNLCTWEWSRLGPIEGYKVVGPNGNSVFLPFAGYIRERHEAQSDGYYRSATTDKHLHINLNKIEIYSRQLFLQFGIPIRPVYGDAIGVEGVSLNKSELSLSFGGKAVLKPTLQPSYATNQTIFWSSSNESVATVSPAGEVQALSNGTAVITVTTEDGDKTASCEVTVGGGVESISLDQTELSVYVRESVQLNATILPDNAIDKHVLWSSSDESVATVTGTGVVICRGTGTTIITATSRQGGLTATCLVTGLNHVASISFAKKDYVVYLGEPLTLVPNISPDDASNKTVFWSSSDESIVTVSSTGEVNGVSLGTATITATTEDGGKTATCSVTVKRQRIESLSLDQPEMDLGVGEQKRIQALFLPEDADEQISWSSSDPSVATVTASGMVLCRSLGTTTITATTQEGGLTASCVVRGVTRVKSISLNKTDLSVFLDNSEPVILIATIAPDDATNKTVLWTSSDESIATVSSTGEVRGVSPGTATITATAKDNGKMAVCNVTVKRKHAESIYFDPSVIDLGVQEEKTLQPYAIPDDADEGFLWSSSDDAVVTVSPTGIVKGIKPGTATIKAITEDGGKEATCKVNVAFIPVDNLSLNYSELTLEMGALKKLTVYFQPENASNKDVVWKSSDSSVASVGSSGAVRAKKVGIAIISASTPDGSRSASCLVSVIVQTPEIVDLGLSVKWASFNLGAKQPEGSGGMFFWGCNSSLLFFYANEYPWSKSTEKTILTDLTKYCYNSSDGYNGFTDGKTSLDLEDDAAHVNLGGKWRIPSVDEFNELRESCSWMWTTQNGNNGYLITGPNGNSIFLPARGFREGPSQSGSNTKGCYWSSSLSPNSSTKASCLVFDSSQSLIGEYDRYYGLYIRPVYSE